MTELFVEKGTAVAITARHQDKLDTAVKVVLGICCYYVLGGAAYGLW